MLPDPNCTPGATNPSVTQASIVATICVSGWTSTVRPPESYTDSLKHQQMAAYGETGPTSSYEEDHLIPLELGGAPSDPRNLWPEPGGSPNPKDGVENSAKHAVCDRSMTLAAAQQAIASNWVSLGQQLGVITPASSSTAPPPPTTALSTTAPPATTPSGTGCTPLSSSGNCYKPGQLCPSADHGLTGVGAGGQPIKCVDNDGWRWEPA